ncbi:hypothetical protein ACERJO_11780 [Halalkalibacter sp. AB-rgal2]|uniref:hypothetical protein n=1 Tax=Halalkalibacter sp. AB-rgal2 TaxID=3242695 RepID=UPI00359DB9D8
MARETYRIDIPITTRDEYSSGIGRAKREVSRFEHVIQKTNQRLDRLTNGRWSMTLRAVDRASSVIRSISNYASRAVNRTYHVTVKAIDLATSPIRGIARTATSTLGMLGVAGGVGGGIVMPLKITADRQNMVSAFEVLLGSAEEADKRIDELIDFAGQTPFKREDIFEASRVLEVFTGGALSTGKGLKMVGDIAAGTQTDFNDVALWVGRLYDAMGNGQPVGAMTSRLQEMGAISGSARQKIEDLAESGNDISETWPQVTKEFERYDDMMIKMSDNLANLFLGVRSFFMNNIVMRWGEGLRRSIQPGLEAFREWRGENAAGIAMMAEEVERFGERAANGIMNPLRRGGKVLGDWFNLLFPAINDDLLEMEVSGSLDPKLQQEINKIRQLADEPFSVRFEMVMEDFKENYLEEWFHSAKQKVPDLAFNLGQTYGDFIRAGLLAILGDEGEDGFASIGSQAGHAFVNGLVDAIDPWDMVKRITGKVWQVNVDAFTGQGSIVGAVFANALVLAALTKLAPGLKLIKSLLKGALNIGAWTWGMTPWGKGGGGKNNRGGGGSPPVIPPNGENNRGGKNNSPSTPSSNQSNIPPKTLPNAGGPPVIVDSRGNPMSTTQSTSPAHTRRSFWDRMSTPFKRALEPLKRIGGNVENPTKGARTALQRVPLLGTVLGALSIIGAPEGKRTNAVGGVAGALAGGTAGAKGGAMIGGSIGALFGGVGAAPGAAIGGVIGGIGGSIAGSIGGESIVANWESIKEKATETATWIGDKFEEAKDTISSTIFDGGWWSEKWNEVKSWGSQKLEDTSSWWEGVKETASETLFSASWWVEQAGFVYGYLESTLFNGSWWAGHWESIKDVTEGTIFDGEWWTSKWDEIKENAAEKWKEYQTVWDMVIEGISNTLLNQEWWSSKWGDLKDDAVEKWKEYQTIWEAVQEDISDTLLNLEWWSGKWDDIKETSSSKWDEFTTIWEAVQEGISSSLFSQEWWAGKWEGVKGWASSVLSDISASASNLFSSFDEGRAKGQEASGTSNRVTASARPSSTPRYANGGLITSPHLGLVGEAGPEMIIPLSAGKRGRAMDLYNQAGQMLGINSYENGGESSLVNSSISQSFNQDDSSRSSTYPLAGSQSGTSVVINMNDLFNGATFEINSDDDYEEIGYKIATATAEAFSNM